jgi:predicted transcriptional regulator
VTSPNGRLVGRIRAETVMQAVLQRVARPAGFREPASVEVFQ